MLFPDSRYRFSSRRQSNKKPVAAIIILAVIVLGVTFLVLFLSGVFGKDRDSGAPAGRAPGETLAELWEKRNYEVLSARCEELLLQNPLNLEALTYNGFSCFYRAVGQFSLEDRLPLVDSAIVNLRKALTAEKNPLTGSIQFILGKAYYLKGRYYYDLAAKYLEESLKSGYNGDDTYEYLGLVYYGLNQYEKSAENYLRALELKELDTISLALAQTYVQMKEPEKAEIYLSRALAGTSDYTVEEKSRFLLGRIYTDRDELDRAEGEYMTILDKNANSADAHYYLGEIYETRGNKTKARYEWRKAVEIDPTHYGARLKLY